MSGERVLADTQGKFTQVVRDGRELREVTWTQGRIVLSSKRVALVGNEGKRTIPLEKLDSPDGRFDVNQPVAAEANYVSLRYDDNVVLVASGDDRFETALLRALLDGSVALVRHPAVAGGVVQDTEYQKARFSLSKETLSIATAEDRFIEVDLEEIGSVEANERTVQGTDRRVLDVEHAEAGTSVHTHLTGKARDVAVLESFLRRGERRNDTTLDLGADEKEVLMALYSGVTPFEIPEFLGMDADAVEEIYEDLVELDVLDEVRIRREVTLTARGRNLASEAMNDR